MGHHSHFCWKKKKQLYELTYEVSLPCLRDNERTSDSILIIVHVEPHLKTNLSLSIQSRWSEQEFLSWSNGGTIYRVSQYEYIHILYICPLRQKKKRKKEKESPSKAFLFLAPLLAEMILFSWLSIKVIILLDLRSGSLVFLLFFSVIFVIFVCLFPPIRTRWPTP